MYTKLIYYIATFLVSITLFFYLPTRIFAQDYTLPYPGFMPGHPLYKLSELTDKIQEWWSFGSLSGFKQHLLLADKKLIEAKTLFEYKQYLLAIKALSKYKEHFSKANLLLARAQNEGKDTDKQRVILASAKKKHISVLEELKTELPEEFIWAPEKATAQTLRIRKLIDDAINN